MILLVFSFPFACKGRSNDEEGGEEDKTSRRKHGRHEMDRTFFHVLFPSIVIARFFRFYKPLSTTNFSIKDFLNSKFVFLMNEINLSRNLIKGLFSFNTTDISSFAILYSLRSFRVLSFEMIIIIMKFEKVGEVPPSLPPQHSFYRVDDLQ